VQVNGGRLEFKDGGIQEDGGGVKGDSTNDGVY
jgi:hypothetical protein